MEANLLKIDKKSNENIGIYNIRYITSKNLMIMKVNLQVNHANEYIEEKNGNKYLAFDSTNDNKDLEKNIKMFGVESKTK